MSDSKKLAKQRLENDITTVAGDSVVRPTMKLELIVNRGLTVMVNGKRPTEKDWSFGDTDDECGVYFDNGGLTFGSRILTDITLDQPWNFTMDNLPTKVTITISGRKVILPIKKLVIGVPKGKRVTLVNGEKVVLDEINTYIRAEGN